MLLTIHAVVLGRKIWLSTGEVAFWAFINWGSSLTMDGGPQAVSQPAGGSVLTDVANRGLAILAAVMVISALAGAIMRRAKALLVNGGMLAIAGVWMVAFAALDYLVPGAYAHKGELLEAWLLIGVVQIGLGWVQIGKYRSVAPWLAEVSAVTGEQRAEMRKLLKTFGKVGEDYFQGRIRATVTDKGLLRRYPTAYWGQLLENQAVMFSRHLTDAMAVTREDACRAKFSKHGLTVGVKATDGRMKQLLLSPLSLLCLKRWTDVPATEKDFLAAAWRKKLTLEVLADFLASEYPQSRVAALKSLRRLKGQAQATLPAAAALLNDAEEEVRAAAVTACRELRGGGLHDRIIPLLGDAAPRVRQAAAEYLIAYPSARAHQPLQQAWGSEQDAAVGKKLAKAVEACASSSV